MKKYIVRLNGLIYANATVIIEADNSDEAVEKAFLADEIGKVEWNIGNDVDEVQFYSVDPDDSNRADSYFPDYLETTVHEIEEG